MNYIKGKILLISKKNYFFILNNNIGYKIHTYHISLFNTQSIAELYIIKTDSNNYKYIGCHNYEEYLIMENILKKKGIGPKTALNIFNKSNVKNIKDIIANTNKNYLI